MQRAHPPSSDQQPWIANQDFGQCLETDGAESLLGLLGSRSYGPDDCSRDFSHAVLDVKEGTHKLEGLLAFDVGLAILDQRPATG
jgi:hypothetical protein